MRARLICQVSLPGDVDRIEPLSQGGWWVTRRDAPRQAIVLDRSLQEVRRPRAPAIARHEGHAVDPEGRAVAVSRDDGVEVSGESALGTFRWRLQHRSWSDYPSALGDCAFSLSGAEVWAVVRPYCSDDEEGPDVGTESEDLVDGMDAPDDEEEDAWDDSEYQCWVLDRATGQLLARAPLDGFSDESHSFIVVHPDGCHMGVFSVLPGDGVMGHWARRDGQRLVTTPIWPFRGEPALCAIAPDGQHYVNETWTTLSTHAFPTGELIAQRPAVDALVRQSRNCHFAYYDASTLLVTPMNTDSNRDVVTTAFHAPSLKPLGEVQYPTSMKPERIVSAGDQSWLTICGTKVARWTFT